MSFLPTTGLGTWKIPKEKTANVVYAAIQAGVRHLDCACDYGNEVQVGEGIRRAITDGIVTRDDLFITSKLWNTYHRQQHIGPAVKRSLDDLGVDYLDLYMVHFPIAQKFVPFDVKYPPEWIFDPSVSPPAIVLDAVPIQETWRGMEDLCSRGITKRIGVCNFGVALLMDLMNYATIQPAVLQVELHPLNSQKALVEFCQSRGIVVTAFSPLGSPSYVCLGMDDSLGPGLLIHPIIVAIAAKHSKTAAQVLLRWNVQRNVHVIWKTVSVGRMAENMDVESWRLDEDDVLSIDALNRNKRFNDPGEFCKGMGGAIPIYA